MQEMIQETKELEFILCPRKKLECSRCHRKLNTNCFIFNRVLKTDVCHQCNKSTGTNPFYNPFWRKQRNYVGIRNMSGQEIKIQISNLVKQGLPYEKARNRVLNDLRVVRHQKVVKVSPECPISSNLRVQKDRSELNKQLVENLRLNK